MAIYLSGPRVLTYGELPRCPDSGVNLRCPDCKVLKSARRDVWTYTLKHRDDERAKCWDCGMALELVRARTVYDVISPEEAEAK
jgi:hypothetical protein